MFKKHFFIFSVILFSVLAQNCEAQNSIDQKYLFSVSEIDSIQFNSSRHKSFKSKKMSIDHPVKITDFEEAKKMLRGIVEFTGEVQAVKKIHFRNGEQFESSDFFYFIAYYPEEDILLCEGGHTTDISFNLKNGKETPEVGNPDLISTSPDHKYRLNGHYNGQECCSYFIQKKVNNEFLKIIDLDEEFREITNKWLCVVGESFWMKETLYLKEISDHREEGLIAHYFEIKIIEQ